MQLVFFMQDTRAIYGAERATLDLAHGLREAGDDPRFFLIEERRGGGGTSALRAAIVEAGFPVTDFPVDGRLSLGLARRVRDAFRAAPGDVLHAVGYKANLHARLSGVRPVVATVHGWLFRADPKERLYDAIDRWCLRRCDRVICLSRFYEHMLLDHGVQRGRLRLIASGLREMPAASSGRECAGDPPSLVFGMMGRFSEEKNHALFLRAAARVQRRHPGARFRIAGQGPLEEELKAMARRLGISSSVEWPGYCRVQDFFPGIDVYVICSNMENLPYSILEAMAWSRPVIGTRVGGIPDVVEDQVTGRLVEPGDEEALASAMMAMLDRPDLIRHMGRQGRQKAERECTLDRMVQQHQSLYREVAS